MGAGVWWGKEGDVVFEYQYKPCNVTDNCLKVHGERSRDVYSDILQGIYKIILAKVKLCTQKHHAHEILKSEIYAEYIYNIVHKIGHLPQMCQIVVGPQFQKLTF